MKVTLITATFNCEATISRCLSSIWSQTWDHIEHIVIDGNSTDSTVNIIREQSPNSKIFSESDKGLYYALNKGIARASSDIVGFLHSDDYFATADVLEKIMTAFSMNGAKGVYGDLVYIRKNGKIIRNWKSEDFTPRMLRRGWMPPHPTLFLRKEVYKRHGGFDTRFRIAADYDFVLRILGSGDVPVHYIPSSLVLMSTGGVSNRSLRNIIQKSTEDYVALRRNKIPMPLFVLAVKNLRKAGQFF